MIMASIIQPGGISMMVNMNWHELKMTLYLALCWFLSCSCSEEQLRYSNTKAATMGAPRAEKDFGDTQKFGKFGKFWDTRQRVSESFRIPKLVSNDKRLILPSYFRMIFKLKRWGSQNFKTFVGRQTPNPDVITIKVSNQKEFARGQILIYSSNECV